MRHGLPAALWEVVWFRSRAGAGQGRGEGLRPRALSIVRFRHAIVSYATDPVDIPPQQTHAVVRYPKNRGKAMVLKLPKKPQARWQVLEMAGAAAYPGLLEPLASVADVR